MAGSLSAAGVNVIGLIDRRARAEIDADAAASAAGSGDSRFLEAGIVGVSGRRAVCGCTVVSSGGVRVELECDAILSAGGYAPAVHLHSQAGGKLRWLNDSSMFVPDGAAPGLSSVGACAGSVPRDAALEHAARVARRSRAGAPSPAAPVGGAGRALPATQAASGQGKQFVDLQNDVTADDVGLAARENYRAVEHLKRYTTTGAIRN